MNCSDIQQLNKRFLQDLLTDEEYQTFLSHLETCPKCKDYVRSTGSLSTQLWELGDIKVPEDLLSTIVFKLSHAQEKSARSRPKTKVPKKMILCNI